MFICTRVVVPSGDGRNEMLPENMLNSTREDCSRRVGRTVEGGTSERDLEVGLRRGQGTLGRLLTSS